VAHAVSRPSGRSVYRLGTEGNGCVSGLGSSWLCALTTAAVFDVIHIPPRSILLRSLHR
jgi:hypothetical protein